MPAGVRYHHGLVHYDRPNNERWHIILNRTTGDVTVHRPGGEPYELGPSQPYRPLASSKHPPGPP